VGSRGRSGGAIYPLSYKCLVDHNHLNNVHECVRHWGQIPHKHEVNNFILTRHRCFIYFLHVSYTHLFWCELALSDLLLCFLFLLTWFCQFGLWFRYNNASYKYVTVHLLCFTNLNCDCDVQIPLMRLCCSMIAMCRFLSWGFVAQWLRCADSPHKVLLLNDCDVQIPLMRFCYSMNAMCRFLSWGFVAQWLRLYFFVAIVFSVPLRIMISD
jgi:hypothetical protein